MTAHPEEDEADEEPLFGPDASEDDFEEDLEEEGSASGDDSPGSKADKRAVHVRRAIERHRERRALRALIADGFAEPWDELDRSSSLSAGARPRS